MNGVNVTDRGDRRNGFTDYDSFQEVEISAGSPAEIATPGLYLNLVAKTGSDISRRR
jgi:hypothetical protein